MSNQRKPFDICVIGSGAGGAPIAASLAQKGLRVALVDRGADYALKDSTKDELRICRQSTFQPDKKSGIREIYYGEAPSLEGNHLWTGTCIGGGTRVMSGFFFPMQSNDFSPLTNFGRIVGADQQDWPITLQELLPYYDQVEKDIGISGDAQATPGREKPFPLAPLDAHPISTLIDNACTRLGYHPFPTPRAVLSRDFPDQDRGQCSYSGFCGSYACLTGAKASTHETYIKAGQKTKNFALLSNHYVYRLEAQAGRIVAANLFDQNNLSRKIRARIFILACSTIETARLLLNSHSFTYPEGLANASGQVGKNLTFTMPCEVTGYFKKGIFPAPTSGSSPFVQRSLQDFHILDSEKLGYNRGGTVVFLFPHANPIQRMILLSYNHQGQRLYGKQLKQKMQDYFSYHHLQSDSFIEFLPNPGTLVTISPKLRDSWGIPVAKIAYKPHAQNILAAQVMAQKIAGIYLTMGAEKIAFNPSPFTAGELQQGTCRFGNDPKTSVLNKFCRSHDIQNLYITDASFMPSGLPVPSTFTIMANSLRVADYIYQRG